MAKLTPLEDRRRHIMHEAAKRWTDRPRGQKVRDQLAALGGEASGFDTPLREKQFAERTAVLQQAAALREAGQLPIGLERKIGATLDFVENAPSEAARKAGRPVVRMITTCDPKVVAVGFATGFVVSPRLILTNWHVFPDVAQARGNGANFFYERDERGVGLGEIFEIDPDYFFLSNERLDFALVGFKSTSVSGAALADVNPIAMTSSPAKILVGQPVNIIQHPDGGPKTWVTMNENRLIDISDEGFLQYTADTLQGSSGSPVFSTSWELVGLHHSGVPEMHDGKIVSTEGTAWNEDMGDEKIHWIANEGARTSAIVRALAETRLDDPRQQGILNNLLAGTADPIEQVKQLLGATAAESTGAQVAAGAAPVIGAGDRQMVFTGPVTIIMGGAQAADGAAPLGEAFERTIQFDPNYDDREGYQADFLGAGLAVPAPTVAKARDAEILMKDGAPHVLDYHHYSVVLNSSRRLPMWTAANVDYSPERRKIGGRAGFGSDKWVFDPRIPKEVQLGDQFYEPAHQSDRGHIVRRQDSAWGDTRGGSRIRQFRHLPLDQLHAPACGVQPRRRAEQISAEGRAVGRVRNVHAGPADPRRHTRLHSRRPGARRGRPRGRPRQGPGEDPRRFWKVVVVAAADAKKPALQAYGFLLSQDDLLEKFGIEFAPGRFAKYRTSLKDIAKASGIEFDKALLAAEVAVQG